MSNFLRNCQTVFYRDCSVLHSHQHCVSIRISLSSTTLVIFLLKIIAVLVGVKWYLIVVFICIPLMTNDIEHLFICLLTICSSSLEKYLFRSFAQDCLSFCCLVVRVLYVFWLHVPYQISDLQIFRSLLCVVFSLSRWCPLKHKILEFRWNWKFI